MNSEKENITETAGRIIVRLGTEGLTRDLLARELKSKGANLPASFRDKDDIFIFLLLGLGGELNELVGRIAAEGKSPDMELEMLFKELYGVFRLHPWYLPVIFDSGLTERNEKTKKIISRIKGMAKKYLSELIDRGKKEKVFTTGESTKVLVNDILGSFRALMNDLQLADKVIQDIKKLQSIQD